MRALQTAIQEATDADYQVRVMAVFESLTTLSPGIGFLRRFRVAPFARVRPGWRSEPWVVGWLLALVAFADLASRDRAGSLTRAESDAKNRFR